MVKKNRERRKNMHLRRLVNCAYGLGMLCASNPILAQPGHAAKAFHGPGTQTGTFRHSHDSAPRLVFLQLDMQDWVQPEVLIDPISIMDYKHPARESLLQQLDALQTEQLEFSRQSLSKLSDGLGFDLPMAGEGNLHFNIGMKRGAETRGVRLPWLPLDKHRRDHLTEPTWSMGVTVDTIRDQTGKTEALIVPQIMLDLDGLFGRDSRLQALIEYGHWAGNAGGPVTDVRVAQATLRLQF